MPETFPLADVLTVTTGRLPCRDLVDGLYRILNYLTGDNLYTHQLGRATEACRPALVEQYPWLADAMPPDGMVVPELFAWLAEQERVHGDSLTIAPMDGWLRVDPIAEAVDRFGPDKVIVVDMTGAGEN